MKTHRPTPSARFRKGGGGRRPPQLVERKADAEGVRDLIPWDSSRSHDAPLELRSYPGRSNRVASRTISSVPVWPAQPAAAFFPARTAARAWREEFESAVDEVLAAPGSHASLIARSLDHSGGNRSLDRSSPGHRPCRRRARRKRRVGPASDRRLGQPTSARVHRPSARKRRDGTRPAASCRKPRGSRRDCAADDRVCRGTWRVFVCRP